VRVCRCKLDDFGREIHTNKRAHTEVDHLDDGVLEVEEAVDAGAVPVAHLGLHLLRVVPVVRHNVVLRVHQQDVLVLDVCVRRDGGPPPPPRGAKLGPITGG